MQVYANKDSSSASCFTENTTGISVTKNKKLKASKGTDHPEEFYLLGYNGRLASERAKTVHALDRAATVTG
jgi:hypothetical protein